MKKWFILLVVFFVSGFIVSTSSCNLKREEPMNIELLPTMYSDSNAKNQIWVGTFQLVWNDLIEELVKHPIEFVNHESIMAEDLNKRTFTKNELSENSYYKKCGLVSPTLKTEIENEIMQKFNETSDILELIDWAPAPKKYILYAMLKKEFEFIESLKKMNKDSFNGSEQEVEYFGLGSDASEEQRESIRVLFYNNENDFALQLKSKNGDIISLYRTDDYKNLGEYFNDLTKKTNTIREHFNNKDTFKVPLLDFNLSNEFEELSNKEIKNSEFVISRAIETVKFKMNEVGVKLKSEAAIIQERGMLPNFNYKPRHYWFNSQYVLFISEEGKKPYLGIKIGDAASLQNSDNK